jgi:hypothetical protein
MIFVLFLILYTTEADLFESIQDKDYDIILNDLEKLRNDPININTADFDELCRIPFLTINDCLKIIEYRQQSGVYTSFKDMLKIPGFDEFFIEKIKPYISIKRKTIRLHKLDLRGRLKTGLPETPGSFEYYTRSKCSYHDYSVYLVTERDSFEPSLFDYLATGIIIGSNTRVFALGKYNLDIGSGVMLSPLGSFFGATDFRILMNQHGLLPYTSVLENSGFFGAALRDSLWTNFTVFFSNQKLDGRIDTSGYARSFDITGEHTDSLSQARKDRINEELFGYNLEYRIDNFYFTHQSYICSYDPQFACRDSLVEFYGDKFWMSGFFLKYLHNDFIIFSEVARSFRNRIGGLFGCSGFVPLFDIELAGKYFPGGYYSPKGIEAEDNYYGGILNITNHSKYLDLGAGFTMDSKLDEDSVKYGLRVNIAKSLGIFLARFQIRFRYTSRILDLSGSKFFIRLKPVKQLFFDLRLEEKYVFGPDSTEKGMFGGLEMVIDLSRIRLRGRYGVFNTDSYASRLFVYETDLPGVITNRILYHKGECGFVHLMIRPMDLFKITCKYAMVKRDTLRQEQLSAQIDIVLH